MAAACGGSLEVGAEVWVPCKDEVWRAGIVVDFDENDTIDAAPFGTPRGSPKFTVRPNPDAGPSPSGTPRGSPKFTVRPSPDAGSSPFGTPRGSPKCTGRPSPDAGPSGCVVVQVASAAGRNSLSAGKGGRGNPSLPQTERVRVSRRSLADRQQLHLKNEVLRTRTGALGLHDLGHLPLLHEPAVLQALQLRFQADVVYTLTGPMLLAINPFKLLPQLYGPERLAAFAQRAAVVPSNDNSDEQARSQNAEEPHIYGVAMAAYQGVWHRGKGQTVLVSGESGAGKTETTKFVMRFLALAGTGGSESSMSAVERKVLDSIPVLEALGNAKTLRNENSSRFGKYIELQFRPESAGAAPRLVGAHTHTYLLEKGRVIGQQDGERSFHIFYQLLEAAKKADASVLSGVARGKSPAHFAYLRGSNCSTLDSGCLDESLAFDETVAAMRAFGLSDGELSDLLSSLLAILYLGNISFVTPSTNSEGSEPALDAESGEAMQQACEFLGIKQAAMAKAWCSRTMQAPGEGVISMPNPVDKALDSRDSLARHLYGAIFSFVVSRINTAVSNRSGGRASLAFVGVLDIFGFEFFANNSLEQLFINFTNELLQQYFNEVIFEHEADLYAQEGIEWDPLDFPDNRAIVDMVGGKIPPGVLPMLDEECMTIGGNSEQWCSKLQRVHGASQHFSLAKLRQTSFIVTHFAGPVEYASKFFVEKNRDALSSDLVKCMKDSSSAFVRQLFQEQERTFGTKESVDAQTGARRMARARLYTVSSEFRGQLQDLMERIRATEPHFVRCIKPNATSSAEVFDRRSVVQQLQYQGVLQAIEVSRVGFPVRLRHRQAVLEFRCLARSAAERLQLESQCARGQFAFAAQQLFRGLSEEGIGADQQHKLPSNTWAVGKGMVFLKQQAMETLSFSLSRCRRAAATHIQACWRRWHRRRRFLAVLRASRRLQAASRGLLGRRLEAAKRRARAVQLIQARIRGQRSRALCRRRLHALGVIQAWSRARHLRAWLLRLLAASSRLRRWWRRKISALRAWRQGMSAIALQRIWRGHMGRCAALRQVEALAKRQQAARRLLQRWREKVCFRLLEKGLDEFLGQADPAVAAAKVADRLQDVSDGKLHATIGALRARLVHAEREAEMLRREEEVLRLHTLELGRWTVTGILGRLVGGIVDGVCTTLQALHSRFTERSLPPGEDQLRPPEALQALHNRFPERSLPPGEDQLSPPEDAQFAD
ncbi:unnamed protein product [Polarella glacialis]|uniref:Myosin motor domain-containing protein n=1 Tax=Polarella glacialis TaxID=89957 RepID=A0A813EGH7_POLGL|nr:unnamed protein product [Polarella glacialis]CAE8645045.1 unnamed protein product [Polarella glacialis]